MATKSKKTKSRVNKTAKKDSNKTNFSIWYAFTAVLIVATAGIGIIYYSNAATVANQHFTINTVTYSGSDGYTTRINIPGHSSLDRAGKFRSGAIRWRDVSLASCYTVASDRATFFKSYGTKQERFYNNEPIVVSKKSSCNL